MAALRHSLQRELFLPAEERLVGLVHVTSAGKKKKVPCFLCIALTPDQTVGANIYKVEIIRISILVCLGVVLVIGSPLPPIENRRSG